MTIQRDALPVATLQTILGWIEDPSEYEIRVDGHKVEFIDDYGLSCGSNGSFWIAGHEFGPTVLVHADSFDSAWGAWIDECPTIPKDELPDAYGVSDSEEMASWQETNPAPPWGSPEYSGWIDRKHDAEKAILAAWGESDDPPDLIEGYEYQSNASGTGIVDVGHYSWMREADLSEVVIFPKLAADPRAENKTAV